MTGELTHVQREKAGKLILRFLDPEDLGYSVGPVIRDLARQVIGLAPSESYLARQPKGAPGPAAPKHSHYHRDVSKLQGMDWYRFCEVFGVTHPCAQHAGKKIVFAGMRGAKDIDKDIQEAIDTLQRWQQMRREDSVSSN